MGKYVNNAPWNGLVCIDDHAIDMLWEAIVECHPCAIFDVVLAMLKYLSYYVFIFMYKPCLPRKFGKSPHDVQ